jgi:hypothetical protein
LDGIKDTIHRKKARARNSLAREDLMKICRDDNKVTCLNHRKKTREQPKSLKNPKCSDIRSVLHHLITLTILVTIRDSDSSDRGALAGGSLVLGSGSPGFDGSSLVLGDSSAILLLGLLGGAFDELDSGSKKGFLTALASSNHIRQPPQAGGRLVCGAELIIAKDMNDLLVGLPDIRNLVLLRV